MTTSPSTPSDPQPETREVTQTFVGCEKNQIRIAARTTAGVPFLIVLDVDRARHLHAALGAVLSFSGDLSHE